MNICIPVKTNIGLKAKVNPHFGSAPYFLIYNTEDKNINVIENSDRNHVHGMCHPLNALQKQDINIIICGGMGARAVQNLNMNGVWAYRAKGETVEEIIEEYKQGNLKAITVKNACKEHHCS